MEERNGRKEWKKEGRKRDFEEFINQSQNGEEEYTRCTYIHTYIKTQIHT